MHSVQDLSETETIMNSTPIDLVDGGKRGANAGPGSRRGSNTLKPPLNGRNTSLSHSLTPSKNLSRNSPRDSPLNSPRGSPAFARVSQQYRSR